MGSVSDIVTIKDDKNPGDSSLYEMHYLYCDNCGAFELENWIEPENYIQLENYQKQLSILIFLAAFGLLIGIIWLISGGSNLIALLSFLFLLLIVSTQRFLVAKIKLKGARCQNCDTEYEQDSLFFQHFTKNPQNLSLNDITIPLHFAYKIQGKYLGPEKKNQINDL